MANLTWAKTETGYAADSYTLTRTPGKRWVVEYNGTPLADGKQFVKLADAKQVAEDHRAAQEREYAAKIIATAIDIAATLTPEQAKAGMADVMGVEHRADPTPTTTAASAPTTATATPSDASTASSSSGGSCGAFRDVLTQPKFCRPVVRESLTDQFTRLYFYHDIGIARRALRESA